MVVCEDLKNKVAPYLFAERQRKLITQPAKSINIEKTEDLGRTS